MSRGDPLPRAEYHLPRVLTREEVFRFLDCIANIKHRTVLMTCYGAGLRISEAVGLKVSYIDSKRMLIFVRQGKRHKDRMVPLSTVLLDQLRAYWKAVRPTDWLFPGRYGKPLSVRTVQTVNRLSRDAVHQKTRPSRALLLTRDGTPAPPPPVAYPDHRAGR